MDPIPAWLRRLWNVWDLRLLVLLSLTLQIILTLCGNRRKNRSSPWIRIPVWSAYLIADWAATVALGKLSDAQYDNGNALRAIWAPLLLLHLGGPDTITAYSWEDNYLWMRHLFGLGVQFSVAFYVILLSWKHSWFSIMSIPALVAGLIKYGERTWVLCSVSRESGKIVPLGNVGRRSEDKSEEILASSGDSNLGRNNMLGDEKSIRALCIAQRCVKKFLGYTQYYDIEHIKFALDKPLDLYGNTLFWEAIEVEMGLVFDVLYTKAPINFTKEGWILRFITFSCTMVVLIGLILQLNSTRKERLKVDIAITVMLLVGALAMEIYATISLYFFSDWAIYWLNERTIFRGKCVIWLRKRFSWLFLPEQYRCRAIAQFNVLDYFLDYVEPGSKMHRRRLRSLLGYLKDMFEMNPSKTADIDPSKMCNPILSIRDYLHMPITKFMEWARARAQTHLLTPRGGHERIFHEDDEFWITFFQLPLYVQILRLHLATEMCYHLGEKTPAGQAMPSTEDDDDRELCIKLSRYMMYLVVMRPSLLPMNVSGNVVWSIIRYLKQHIRKEPSKSSGSMSMKVRACQQLLEADGSSKFKIMYIFDHIQKTYKKRRWEMLKWVWVRMLCDAAIKGPRNEHFRQLSQGGEFITFLWFFLPQSTQLRDEGRLVP